MKHRDVVRSALTPLTKEGITREDILMILLGRLYLFVLVILVSWVAVIVYIFALALT
jgi:hypothetical protein